MNIVTPKRRIVLVVEDEFIIREYAAEVLAEAGFEVLRASDAPEALEILEETPGIAAVFTDVSMPGSPDGLGLAREIGRRWPHIAVVVTSGHIRPARDEVPGRFIGKPYQPEMVVNAIAEGIGGHSPRY